MLCIAIKYGIDNKYIKKNAEVNLLKNIKNIDEYIDGDFHVQRILSKYDMASSSLSSRTKSAKKLPKKKEPKPCKEHQYRASNGRCRNKEGEKPKRKVPPKQSRTSPIQTLNDANNAVLQAQQALT